jgi:hypothetical protein
MRKVLVLTALAMGIVGVLVLLLTASHSVAAAPRITSASGALIEDIFDRLRPDPKFAGVLLALKQRPSGQWPPCKADDARAALRPVALRSTANTPAACDGHYMIFEPDDCPGCGDGWLAWSNGGPWCVGYDRIWQGCCYTDVSCWHEGCYE